MIKKTAQEWFEDDAKTGIAYRTLAWNFEEPAAFSEKITEQEYVDKYVHPNDRWKV